MKNHFRLLGSLDPTETDSIAHICNRGKCEENFECFINDQNIT